ncbi:MAG: hypothetical protein J7501_11980 [Bdellovibrio sp.]|nr:hypothetical protein [Bdellovibrio sp.]
MDEQEYKRFIEKIHREACERGELSYIDPRTGYTVFTEHSHLKRGSCCGSGCRHCPWKNIKHKTED